MLTVQYSTGTAWQSEAIRRLCHSQYSHVDLVIPGVGLLGASGPDKSVKAFDSHWIPAPDPGGVQIRPFNPWPYKEPPKQIRLQVPEMIEAQVYALARSQIGKPFDNSALYDFLSADPGSRDWRDQDKWFCSELVVWCCETCGMFPYKLISAKNRISPADSLLLFNPFIVPEDI